MELIVTSRQNKTAKDLRKEGLIPGIIYGKHLKEAIAVACKRNPLIKAYKEAGYSTPLTITDEEKLNQLVLIQDIQLDPVTDILLHIDFLAVNKDEKVTTEIPVKMIGESMIEKLGQGKIQLLKDFIEVEAFPQDLPHDITIDISIIETMGHTIFVKDLKLSSKVRILDDLEQPLVTVLSLAEEEVEATPVATAETTPAAGAVPAEGATPAADKDEKKKDDKKK
ncbi:MAG: 50S ribosomal protein L25 [candidate division SR1 bacterium]|nr:50S ribosomal protein L25 [candidate division SR1 bacterium]